MPPAGRSHAMPNAWPCRSRCPTCVLSCSAWRCPIPTGSHLQFSRFCASILPPALFRPPGRAAAMADSGVSPGGPRISSAKRKRCARGTPAVRAVPLPRPPLPPPLPPPPPLFPTLGGCPCAGWLRWSRTLVQQQLLQVQPEVHPEQCVATAACHAQPVARLSKQVAEAAAAAAAAGGELVACTITAAPVLEEERTSSSSSSSVSSSQRNQRMRGWTRALRTAPLPRRCSCHNQRPTRR